MLRVCRWWLFGDNGTMGKLTHWSTLCKFAPLPLDNRENKNSRNVCLSQIRENIFPRKFLLIQYHLRRVWWLNWWRDLVSHWWRSQTTVGHGRCPGELQMLRVIPCCSDLQGLTVCGFSSGNLLSIPGCCHAHRNTQLSWAGNDARLCQKPFRSQEGWGQSVICRPGL